MRELMVCENIRELKHVFAASLVFASAGALLAWPAAALPRLTAVPPSDDPALTSTQGSWAVAALHAGQVLGAAPGALLAARAGRRPALLVCAPPLAAAWLLLAFSGAVDDGGGGGVSMLLVARVLGGIGVGVAFAAGPLYAAEAASVRLRGAAGALVQLALSLGQLLAYCGGAWLSLRTLALAAASLPVLFAVAFWASPESPHWLLRAGRRQEARDALKFLRGPNVQSETIDVELASFEDYAYAKETERNSGNNNSNLVGSWSTGVESTSSNVEAMSVNVPPESHDTAICDTATSDILVKPKENANVNVELSSNDINECEPNSKFTDSAPTTTGEQSRSSVAMSSSVIVDPTDGPDVQEGKAEMVTEIVGFKSLLQDYTFRRMLIVLLPLVLLQCFGSALVVSPYTTHVLIDGVLSPGLAYIVLGSVQLCGALLSPWLLSVFGRRSTLLASASGAALALAARVYPQKIFAGASASPSAAFAALCTAAFAQALALAPLPSVLAAELSPASARGTVVALVAAIAAAASYAAQRAYEGLWYVGSPYVAAYVSAICCGVISWLSFALLPEAHGLSFPDVQKALHEYFSSSQQAPGRRSHLQQASKQQIIASREGAPSASKEKKEAFRIEVGKFSLIFIRSEDTENNLEMQESTTQEAIHESDSHSNDSRNE